MSPAGMNITRMRLLEEILPLGGYKPAGKREFDPGWGEINQAFPNNQFPLGAIHEFICRNEEDHAASTGFISGILSSLMEEKGVAIWISIKRKAFPPGMKMFGIHPSQIIFIEVRNEKDLLWSLEEALKCPGLAAVVADPEEMNFTTSRRLQLAVEQSRVTGFIFCHDVKQSASVTRWQINSIPGNILQQMPGVGFPQWKVELLKVRNGSPGKWEVNWFENKFNIVYPKISYEEQLQQKAS